MVTTIGERIRKVRKEKNMTQQALADLLKLKQNTIATYEMNKTVPSDRTIEDLCKKLDISEHWLRTGKGDMNISLSRSEELSRHFAKLLYISTAENPTEGEKLKLRIISFLSRLDADSWEALARIAEKWNNENGE